MAATRTKIKFLVTTQAGGGAGGDRFPVYKRASSPLRKRWLGAGLARAAQHLEVLLRRKLPSELSSVERVPFSGIYLSLDRSLDQAKILFTTQTKTVLSSDLSVARVTNCLGS